MECIYKIIEFHHNLNHVIVHNIYITDVYRYTCSYVATCVSKSYYNVHNMLQLATCVSKSYYNVHNMLQLATCVSKSVMYMHTNKLVTRGVR